MKKIYTFLSITLLLALFSCKTETSKNKTNTAIKKYTVEALTTSIGWTAYKTSEKKPVSGKFNKVEITKQNSGSTVLEALNGLEFKIPVNSIFSKNKDRDAKLVNIFFGNMKDTKEITGVITTNNKNSGSVKLKMNGITQELPITYIIDNQMATINATMNLDNWQAQAAIAALNTACKDLHKGTDGISKTWSQVTINIATYLKAN